MFRHFTTDRTSSTTYVPAPTVTYYPANAAIIVAAAFVAVLAASATPASADDFSDVDIDDRVLEITASEFDDMIGIEPNPDDADEIAIYILHFVTSPPHLGFASIDDAIAAADDARIEYRRWERFDQIAVDAGEGNDIVVISPMLDSGVTIHGGPGNDDLYGGTGDDMIDGGTGDDLIDCGEGNDYAIGKSGDDLLYGGDGEDELYGSDGDDILVGNAGSDALVGGPGNDELEGSFDQAEDDLIGGPGADTFRSKYIKLQWKYRKKYNRRTRQWEYSKTKVPEIIESDNALDLNYDAGDQEKSTHVD